MNAGKELIVLDFDHTIIDNNADTYINRLAPGKRIPEEIRNLYSSSDWTPYMQEVFRYLHQNDVRPDDYYKCLAEIPFVTGMKDLLLKIKMNSQYEVIIISDANSLFIDHVLKNAGVLDTVQEVFTNPAYFDSPGSLCLSEYHIQDLCELSSRNLCKGSVLDTYLSKRKKEGVDFVRISYIGDGRNDYCPTLRLKKGDRVFPRENYKLLEQIKKNCDKVKATVFPWENAYDILKVLGL